MVEVVKTSVVANPNFEQSLADDFSSTHQVSNEPAVLTGNGSDGGHHHPTSGYHAKVRNGLLHHRLVPSEEI